MWFIDALPFSYGSLRHAHAVSRGAGTPAGLRIPAAQRHPRIFARFARLAPGETFTLVNNHDPKPLRREFQSAHPGTFTWEYVESGPEQWQIRIGRQADSDD